MIKTVQLFDDKIGKVEYVSHMGSDVSVVNSARVSFGKEVEEVSNKDKKLINYLIKHRHTSTLEHCTVTFRVKVPLYIRSQHHRHRTWSYNEISRRYTDFNLEFYEPKAFRTQHKSNRQASNAEELIDPKIVFYWDESTSGYKASETMREFHQGALELYNSMIEAGVCREQARGVLPQNLYTEYYATANLNNILKFVDLRTHEGAQWEIQQLAKGMLDILTDLYPITVEAWKSNQK
jgi:thymidylate synthase (FAD)